MLENSLEHRECLKNSFEYRDLTTYHTVKQQKSSGYMFDHIEEVKFIKMR